MSTGKLNWLSGAVTDNDGDGCRDSDEDLDDDNDGLLDTIDLCHVVMLVGFQIQALTKIQMVVTIL